MLSVLTILVIADNEPAAVRRRVLADFFQRVFLQFRHDDDDDDDSSSRRLIE